MNAVALADGCTLAEAFKRLGVRTEYAPRPKVAPRPQAEPVPPVPDRERVHRLSELGLLTIIEGRADEWLKHRGITMEWVARCPNLGFVLNAPITGWTRPLVNAWAIRVCTPDGECVALKAHREHVTDGPKSLWLPFGTQPPDKPRHGYATLWPPPEWFDDAEVLYITEGELKAAAVLSAGKNATTPTTGADFRWTPGTVQRLTGRRVCVVFDDDDAGHRFRNNTLNALSGAAAELKAITFGKGHGNE